MTKNFAWAVVYKDTGKIVVDWNTFGLCLYLSRWMARREVKYLNSLRKHKTKVLKVYFCECENAEGMAYYDF